MGPAPANSIYIVPNRLLQGENPRLLCFSMGARNEKDYSSFLVLHQFGQLAVGVCVKQEFTKGEHKDPHQGPAGGWTCHH